MTNNLLDFFITSSTGEPQELTKENITKSEALRRAQMSLLQEERYRSPYFWAAYVLVGSWR